MFNLLQKNSNMQIWNVIYYSIVIWVTLETEPQANNKQMYFHTKCKKKKRNIQSRVKNQNTFYLAQHT